MRKFARPLVAVGAGMAASWGLQAFGVEPLYAKLAGLAVVGAVIYASFRASAAL